MQPFRFLFAILSLLSIAVAGSAISKRNVGTDNYEVLQDAFRKAGKTIDPSKRYALYEYWFIDGEWNCYKYFTHVSLVVGSIADYGSGPEYRGAQYEMRKQGQMGSGGATAEQTTLNYQENWWANHYQNPSTGQWVTNSRKHTYELAGEVGDSPFLEIRGFGQFNHLNTLFIANTNSPAGAEYIRDHPKYNVATNSCQTFAGALFSQIKK